MSEKNLVKVSKSRLDQLLVERGLYLSRESAKGDILAGNIFVNNERSDKPGQLVKDDSDLKIMEKTRKYVSRGGSKLEKALDHFDLDLEKAIAADIGASTGGFTDCMLKKGASKVYSIDVGYGQLAWELRNDNRVVVMERTNARNLTPNDICEKLDFVTIDVSFISLDKILGPVFNLLKENGIVIALIKPQFEAGREKVGKKGVVKSPDTHVHVIEKTLAFSRSIGFHDRGLTFSPIKGPEGNIEFLIFLTKEDSIDEVTNEKVQEVVKSAHAFLA